MYVSTVCFVPQIDCSGLLAVKYGSCRGRQCKPQQGNVRLFVLNAILDFSLICWFAMMR